MATLQVGIDPASPNGGWVLASENPAALAAIPDGLIQLLGYATDSATMWASHPSEQDATISLAYQHERQEIGPEGVVRVVELARPRQQNVVWIDRYHLIARCPAARTPGRLLGLYAGGEGTLAGYVHDVSVSASIETSAANLPNTAGAGWDDPLIVAQCRFAFLYSAKAPGQLRVACPPLFRQQTEATFGRVAQAVAGW